MQMENKLIHLPQVTAENTVVIFSEICDYFHFRKYKAVLCSFFTNALLKWKQLSSQALCQKAIQLDSEKYTHKTISVQMNKAKIETKVFNWLKFH